jgi:hypothetical protein
MRTRGRRLAGVTEAEADPPSQLVRTAPRGAGGRQRVASTRGQTRRRRLPLIASGQRQSNAERGISSHPTLNIAGGVGGECLVMNRQGSDVGVD